MPLDELGVPDAVQVGAGHEKADLQEAPAPAAGIPNVKALVEDLDEVDQELERLLLCSPLGPGVQEDLPEILNLADDAAPWQAVPRVLPGF